MINNIKLDDINTFLDLHKTTVKAAAPVADSDPIRVTINNKMNELVTMVRQDAEPMKPKSLNDIKNSIQNNTYQVDLDALSAKLIGEGIVS